MTNSQEAPTQAVAALEAIYGKPSQAGFGSAVFQKVTGPAEDVAHAAWDTYRFFVGDLWERWGEAAWKGPWREVYVRGADARHDIVAELRGIDDAAARSVPMILDVVERAEDGRAALAAVYDDPDMDEVRVFNLGDGGAMSGLLLAGRRARSTTLLVFLMD